MAAREEMVVRAGQETQKTGIYRAAALFRLMGISNSSSSLQKPSEAWGDVLCF